MSAEKPKALSPPPAVPRPTVAGRPAMTQTLVGHTAPAAPEVTAWLNALLKLDVKPVTPLGEALNVAHAAPTVPAFPAVVDVPELPESALELVPEPPAPPPPPLHVEAAVAPPPPVAAPEPSSPPPPPIVSAAPIEELDPDVDTAIIAGGGGGRRLIALALIGALGLAAALVVRGRHASAPTTSVAPAIVAPPVEAPAVAPPVEAPAAAPPPAPSPHLELGLDPAGAAPPVPAATAEAPQPHSNDGEPQRPRRERATSDTGSDRTAVQRGNALLKEGDPSGAVAAFAEAVRLSPDDPAGYRGLGLAHEQQGEAAEAMDAFKRYIKLATRSRDREWAARHLYQLAHPDE